MQQSTLLCGKSIESASSIVGSALWAADTHISFFSAVTVPGRSADIPGLNLCFKLTKLLGPSPFQPGSLWAPWNVGLMALRIVQAFRDTREDTAQLCTASSLINNKPIIMMSATIRKQNREMAGEKFTTKPEDTCTLSFCRSNTSPKWWWTDRISKLSKTETDAFQYDSSHFNRPSLPREN